MNLGMPPDESNLDREKHQREPEPCASCERWILDRTDGTVCFREAVLERGVTPNSKATRFELAWDCPECKQRWWKFRKTPLRYLRITYPKDPAAAAEAINRLGRKVILEDEA